MEVLAHRVFDVVGVKEGIEARPHRRKYTDQLPSCTDMQPWGARILRRANTGCEGKDPDEVDPTFEDRRTRLIGHDRDRELPRDGVPGRVTPTITR